jgi:uncharacterized protein
MTQARTGLSLAGAAPQHPEWPHRTLDVDQLHREGWRPSPFRDFVLKVHQLCNLTCDYCYIYTMPDASWRNRPKVMSPEIQQAAAERIADHVRAHGLHRVRLILHGGEPLMTGPEILLALASVFRDAIPDQCRVEFGMQTNGVLLNRRTLAKLRDRGISIGVSLDGAAADNNRHRKNHSGRGSFVAVRKALALLGEAEFRPAFAGLLCTIDPTADPIETYKTLASFRPPSIDFLLPHANWERKPESPPGSYAKWLTAVFDEWYATDSAPIRIRLFEEILSLLLGGRSRTEQVGLSPVALLVIDTDGAIEQVDSLKSTYDGACATGLNVMDNSLEGALYHPGLVARQIGVKALCDTCLTCPVHKVCGAGHYVHRFRPGAGFRNPSVYCDDLFALIHHIRERTARDLARRLKDTTHDSPSQPYGR